MSYQPKPRPQITDDICAKHNRRLRDYEIMNGGCFLCCQEANQEALGRSTVIKVLPPVNDVGHEIRGDFYRKNLGFVCELGNCKEQCNQCLENGQMYFK
jgi:hypothetical protein